MSEDFILNLDNSNETKSEEKGNFSYTKYMLFYKIPRRFLQIIVPELIISILLYLGNKAGLFKGISYNIGLIAGLVLYWGITWFFAYRDCSNTSSFGHYYVCNIVAFSLFVFIAAVACIVASTEPSFPYSPGLIFFPFFRLSLVLALIDDGQYFVREILLSFLFFYTITLLIILIQPLLQLIADSVYSRKINRHVKKHNDKFKDMEDALQNSQFRNQKRW